MNKYWFTFGCGQVHENCYHVIEAKSQTEARIEMNLRFGNKWSMIYKSAEAAGVEKYGLREVK